MRKTRKVMTDPSTGSTGSPTGSGSGGLRTYELEYPNKYFALERQKALGGTEIANTTYAVNNVYLDGVRIASLVNTGHARYFLTDQVDSVGVVTNDAGQAITRTEYLPYGETWFMEGDKNYAPKFNSQELDKESNFYFMNARHYDPELARFVTADTVVDGDNAYASWNRYMYVHGNPVMYKDPTGHLGVEPIAPNVTEDQAFETEKYLAKTSVNEREAAGAAEKAQVGNKLQEQKGGDNRIVSKLEITSVVKKNYDGPLGSGVQGKVYFKLTTPEGKVLKHEQNVIWADKENGERPTYPTEPGKNDQIEVINSRKQYTAGEDKVTFRLKTSGKEGQIFIHAGSWSEGCHCVGRGKESENFLKEIERAATSKNFAGLTHEVVDIDRNAEERKLRPGSHIGENWPAPLKLEYKSG